MVLKEMKSFYNSEITALTVEKNDLSKKVMQRPQLALQTRESKSFETWPGWDPVQTQQYPSDDCLSKLDFNDMQVLSIGVNKASLVAQVGSQSIFKTGGYEDETSFQISLNQNRTPIKKVTFKWKNYDNGYYERAHWFFEFFDDRNSLLGRVDNRPD